MRIMILTLLCSVAIVATPLFPLPPVNSGTLEITVCDNAKLICASRLLMIANYDTDVKWKASVLEIKVQTDDGKGRILIFPLSRIAEAIFTPSRSLQ